MVRIDKVEKNLKKMIEFSYRIIEPQDLPKITPMLTKEWKYLINKNFYRRKYMGLKTSNRLRDSIMIKVPEKNVVAWDTRLLSRKTSDGTGGACFDYAEILRHGYAGGKPTMGKWKARSSTGRLIDAQLFDMEGNPIGTHGSMPPYLKYVEEYYAKSGGKLLREYVLKKFARELRKG